MSDRPLEMCGMLLQQNVTQETSQEDANSFLQSNSILGMESAKLPEKFKNEQKESMKSKLLHSQDEALFPSRCPIHFFFFFLLPLGEVIA